MITTEFRHSVFFCAFPKQCVSYTKLNCEQKSRGLLGLITAQASQMQRHIFTSPPFKKNLFSVLLIGSTDSSKRYKVMAAAQVLWNHSSSSWFLCALSEQVAENNEVASWSLFSQTSRFSNSYRFVIYLKSQFYLLFEFQQWDNIFVCFFP